MSQICLLPWSNVAHGFTGYSPEVISQLVSRLNCTNVQVFNALTMLHLNLTHEQTADVLIPYLGKHYSSTHVWKKFIRPALNASDIAGNLAETERRFLVREPHFVLCTSILDGVPMYSR